VGFVRVESALTTDVDDEMWMMDDEIWMILNRGNNLVSPW
jgi:hypothetical protein